MKTAVDTDPPSPRRPCECGSGKQWRLCHGAAKPEAQGRWQHKSPDRPQQPDDDPQAEPRER